MTTHPTCRASLLLLLLISSCSWCHGPPEDSENLPPGPPLSIAAFRVFDTDATIAWRLPVGLDFDFRVCWEFTVELYKAGKMVRSSLHFYEVGHLFTYLEPCTLYNVTVETPCSIDNVFHLVKGTETFRTKAAGVTSLSAVNVTATEILLSWDEPVTQCQITSFLVNPNDGTGNREIPNVKPDENRSPLHYMLDHLKPNTSYTIEVTAVTEAGLGQRRTIPVTTKGDVANRDEATPVNSEVDQDRMDVESKMKVVGIFLIIAAIVFGMSVGMDVESKMKIVGIFLIIAAIVFGMYV